MIVIQNSEQQRRLLFFFFQYYVHVKLLLRSGVVRFGGGE